MRPVFVAVLSVALLFGAAFGQQTPSSTPNPQSPSSDEPPTQQTQQGSSSATAPTSDTRGAKPLKIAPGSVIPVQISKTVDAKKAKTGDEVIATVTQDMKTSSGEVLVPKDTKVIGHVTEAQKRDKEQKQSELGIAFDHAVVKGDQMQLPMSIQAVIAPPSSNNSNAAAPEQSPSMPAGNSPGAAPSAGTNRSGGGMAGSAPSAQQNSPQATGGSESQQQSNERPPINGHTQGVIGMNDVKLEAGSQNSQQGSVLTSEKNNVKIEKGTMLLLRVNQ